MKTKKTIVSLFSLCLAFLMIFSSFAVSASYNSISADEQIVQVEHVGSNNVNILAFQKTINFSQINISTITPTPSYFQGILKGFATSVARRAVQEITTLLIAEDIPGLSKALVALQDPATRAELQHKQLVKEMAVSIAKIEESVSKIESQLNDISDKIDNYATAEALRDAIQELNRIISKYQAAWGNYEAVIIAGDTLAELEALYPEATRTEEQKTYISNAESEMNIAITLFVNSIEEGGGFPFLSDLEKLPQYLWNPSDSTSDYDVSYLGAYEAYLRERYPFEHQITELLGNALETTVDIQTQMLILYREYYTYKKSVAEENDTTYDAYTPEYFTKIQYGLIENTAAMFQSTGFENYIRPRAYTSEELEEIRELDKTFVEGENINSEITINQKTYKAYKIRDNKSLSYYKIIAEEIPSSLIVEKIYSHATNKYDLGKDIYRPSFMLESEFSDDGLYRMISSLDEIPFSLGMTSILSSLRDSNGCNLSDLPQTLTHLLFYEENFTTATVFGDPYWTLTTVPVSNITEAPSGKSTEDLYGDSSFVPLVIYRDTFSNRVFGENNTLVLNDKGLLENQTIVIRDGQTLDISQINLNVSNVTIIISGEGKIVSNPNITLEESNVIITSTEYGDAVYITNLNVKARDKSEAALIIKTSCSIGFEGSNSFIGTSSKASKSDIYQHYNSKKPTLASHGILSRGIVTLAGTVNGTISYPELQSLTAAGAGGGAGICHYYENLYIKTLNVTASGSEISLEKDATGSGEELYTIGAGIGSSVSCTIKTTGSFSVKTDELIVSLGDHTINGANYISIEKSKVTASGVKSNAHIDISNSDLGDEVYSEDIGGVKFTDSGHYYCVKAGSIESSNIILKKNMISSRIATKSADNVYEPETYEITTYTKGSNGVTTDGVYFKLNGTKGSTQWMLAKDCGNDKGSWTGSVKGVSVGQLKTVEVKTNASNHWYPGKISITAKLCGESITVWGGRWIGNEGTLLSPSDNVYEIKVSTGSDSNAGTDAGIYLQLRDISGVTTENIYLSDIHQSANAFEKGNTDTFPIYAPADFKECTNALFYSDYKNALAGWQLEGFEISKVQGGTDGFSFSSGQWFEKKGTINFGKYSGDTGSFYIEVKTQNSSGAGTNSDIWLTIYGSEGNTGEIELDTYAGSGDNFEKNDLDCFHIGCSASIGTIEKIVIRKNNKGVGPNWKLDYIEIVEEISNGKTPQSVKFKINQTIEDSSYTFSNPTPIVKSSSRIDPSILKGIELNDDGSYTLSVDRNIQISEEIFEFLKEESIKLTVEMKDDDKTIYAISFNGSLITDNQTIHLNKGYSFTDGNAMLNFISSASLPAGTTIRLYADNLGFESSDKLVLFSKDENGEWKENITIESENGIIEIPISEGKELLINKSGASLPESDQEDIPSPKDNGLSYLAIIMIISIISIYTIGKKGFLSR